MQSFFSVKITLIGVNLVLMEEMEYGIVLALITEASDWVNEIFEDIRGRSPLDMDMERVV